MQATKELLHPKIMNFVKFVPSRKACWTGKNV